jgi:hypothetical protein
MRRYLYYSISYVNKYTVQFSVTSDNILSYKEGDSEVRYPRRPQPEALSGFAQYPEQR